MRDDMKYVILVSMEKGTPFKVKLRLKFLFLLPSKIKVTLKEERALTEEEVASMTCQEMAMAKDEAVVPTEYEAFALASLRTSSQLSSRTLRTPPHPLPPLELCCPCSIMSHAPCGWYEEVGTAKDKESVERLRCSCLVVV